MPDRTGRHSPVSWNNLFEEEGKKTAKQNWCSGGVRTEREMARQSLNIGSSVQRNTHLWADYCPSMHTYPCKSMFLEKLIGLFLSKLACLIRNNRPDWLAFPKTRQKQGSFFLIKTLCICFWEAGDLLCSLCKIFVSLVHFAMLLKICSASIKFEKICKSFFIFSPQLLMNRARTGRRWFFAQSRALPLLSGI